ASFASSTRLAPLAMISTALPLLARKTRDFAICATSQPMAAAASAALRAVCGSMRTMQSEPAARSFSWTRCAAGAKGSSLISRIRLAGELARAVGGGGARLRQQRIEAAVAHQHLERRLRRPARARHILAKDAGRLARAAGKLAGTGDGGAGQAHRELLGEALR